MASTRGLPATEATLAGDAETDLKTAAPKVPQRRRRSSGAPHASARVQTRRVVDGVVDSGRRWGSATRAVLLRNQRPHQRFPRCSPGPGRHRLRRRAKVETPLLLCADRLPGVVRPRQVGLVLPSRRERTPQLHVGSYVVDVNLRNTARGAVSLLMLAVAGVALGAVLTLGTLAALVWLYQSWIRPTLTQGP